ncbi:MAG: ABC transporter transmembrane domain-containing protein [Acidimicrobiales bacterium]
MLWTGTQLAGPLLVRRAIGRGILGDDVAQLNVSIGLYVVVAIVGYASYRAVIVMLARLGEEYLRDMRTQVFAKLLRQSMSFFDREKAGVLVSRMTSDVDSLRSSCSTG